MVDDVPMRRLLVVLLLSACNGLTQSPECAQYLRCTEAAIPGSAASYQSSYGEGGTCWATSAGAAEQCTEACVQGRRTLGMQAGASKAECR